MKTDLIKESLNSHRTNKTLLWQTLIVTMGGTIGLLLKAVNVSTNSFEILLIVVGFILSFILIYILVSISEDMGRLHAKLNEDNTND